jgi:O-antigen/teichoic acid export membrane protein
MGFQKINHILHNKTVRNGGLFSIFSFFNRGISFVLMVILARYIAPEQYGELGLFNTIVMFLSFIAGLQTAGYLSVSFFKESKEDFNKDLTAICVITCAASACIGLIIVILQDHLAGWLKVSVPFLYIGLATSFCQIFYNLNLDYLRVQEKVSKYGLLSCSFAVLSMMLSLYLVIGAALNWKGRVYAELACCIIYGVISILYFWRRRIFNVCQEWSRYKKIILWGLPIIPHMTSDWVKQGLDRYIIEGTHSMADVGIFSFSLSLAGVMLMVGMAFNATNSVNLYQTLSSNLTMDNTLKSLKKKEHFFSILYFAISIVIIVVGSIAVPIVMPKYATAVPYFVILTIYGFFRCIYFLYCNYLFYFNKTKNLMLITFGTSILHLILSLILTKYSLYCTCGIYVVSQIIICTMVYKMSRRCLKTLQQN